MVNMGHLYKVAGAYDDALDYYRQGLYYAASHNINFQEAHWNYLDESLGIIHGLLNEPDSSVYYLQNALQIDPDNLMTRIAWGENLLTKKQYDSALTFFLNPIERFRKESNKWDLMRILMNTAKAYEGKRNLSTALSYAHESLSLAKEADIKQYMLEGSHVVSRIHQEMRNPDSAYFYLQQYAALKDSVMRKQSFWRLSNYKKQADFKKQFDQIALLDKDNKIKEEQLKRESLWKWILVAFFLVTTLLAFIVYKNLALKRKNEKLQSQQKQAALQQHVTDLEMQALRAQMNPHFVFNCLSSINRFILKNETEAASDYLTKFSRLIRMVLTHSRQTFITLDEELEMLRLYLDMERLRFKDSFDYSIRFTNSIDAGAIYVPPMLLQPFAENAIWHGLMHKDGQRELEIELSVDDKTVTCMITDNGIGRARAAELKSKAAYKQKSMGLEITTQRLALLNINGNQQTFFTIEDLTNDDGKAEGTQVILKINYRDLTEVVSEIA
jgi:tetratricopeptide (TPR) repeat protein